MSFCDTGFDLMGNVTVLLCDEAPATSAAWYEFVLWMFFARDSSHSNWTDLLLMTCGCFLSSSV